MFYAALFAWLFASQRARWAYVDVPSALRWSALVALVPVLVLFRSSFQQLGTNYRGGVGLYERHELVVRGPYAVVRHPIYAAFIAIMLLVLLLSANWVLGLSGLLLVSSIAVVRIPVEEHQLRERFGSAWTDYANNGIAIPFCRTQATLIPRSSRGAKRRDLDLAHIGRLGLDPSLRSG